MSGSIGQREGVCLTEDFCLNVVTVGKVDETEIHEQIGPG